MTLQELVEAGSIAEVPQDPYGPGALVYRPTDNDFTLYSLGQDFLDGGGVHSRWGSGPTGGDQVFWPVGSIEE